MPSFRIHSGTPLPLGAQSRNGGVNFALFSRHATALELLLYDAPEAPQHCALIPLDPARHRTGDIWHVYLESVSPGQVYAWRAHGPYRPEAGLRYNRHKLLLDPYARALCNTRQWDYGAARGYDAAASEGDLSFDERDNEASAARCLVMADDFDWQGDRPLRHDWEDTVIYETHVRGLTIHSSAEATQPGGFLGVIEKIPYLQRLGITSVELMPVQEFNEHELMRRNPRSGEPLRNYWGYSTAAFFAPKEGYGSAAYPGCQVREFKTMVRELHRAGIEVILDMVFNHTAEGDERGPTFGFRGLDNPIYYLLDQDPRHYKNFSGCGNTVNCNHPVVRDYLLDCLRYWALEMHVDGFRFDLASVMERDEEGGLLPDPPLLERIAEDPILREVKLIAEAWDAAGVYQVGRFPGRRWSEWNAAFRDDVRRFWRGDGGMTGAFASRLCGSADLYQRSGKEPLNSINFVTCHDGFTLHDLVSYSRKHNEANGEDNRDGIDENYSANGGVEGPSDDAGILQWRLRQMKNFIATLLLARGVPMLLGGDEFARGQGGNNNAYCQDNAVSWYDWRLLEINAELFEFTRDMIDLRRRHALLRRERFYTDAEVTWFAADGRAPAWGGEARSLGCHLHPPKDAPDELCLLFNAGDAALDFAVPPPRQPRPWRPLFDTARAVADEGRLADDPSLPANGTRYPMAAHSLVLLAV